MEMNFEIKKEVNNIYNKKMYVVKKEETNKQDLKYTTSKKIRVA
jgi:hypothetical protein